MVGELFDILINRFEGIIYDGPARNSGGDITGERYIRQRATPKSCTLIMSDSEGWLSMRLFISDQTFRTAGSAHTFIIWFSTSETHPAACTGRVKSITFIPGASGIHVISTSALSHKDITVWDAGTDSVVAGPFKGHSDSVNCVAFSFNGACVIFGSNDQATRVSYCRPSAVTHAPYFKWLQSTTATFSDTEGTSESDLDPRESSDTLPILEPFPPPPLSPQDYSSEETLAGIVDFKCYKDGWVTSGGVRLFWTPPDLRAHIPFPQDRVVIGHQGSMYINHENLLLGERWTECYMS